LEKFLILRVFKPQIAQRKYARDAKKIIYLLLIQPALRIEAESMTRQLVGNALNNIF